MNRSVARAFALPLTAAALVASGLAVLPTTATAAPTLVVKVVDNNGQLVGASPVVTLYEKTGDQFTKAGAMTSSNASFTVDTTKVYVLGFQDQNGAYLPEYYDNAATLKLADAVVPGAGTMTVNWAVAKAGRATGRIQDSRGDVIRDPAPVINAYRASDCSLVDSPTPKAGADNLVLSLPTGSYKVQVTWDGDPAVYETVWYGGADATATNCADATTLSLIAGTTLTGVDITVPGIPPEPVVPGWRDIAQTAATVTFAYPPQKPLPQTLEGRWRQVGGAWSAWTDLSRKPECTAGGRRCWRLSDLIAGAPLTVQLRITRGGLSEVSGDTVAIPEWPVPGAVRFGKVEFPSAGTAQVPFVKPAQWVDTTYFGRYRVGGSPWTNWAQITGRTWSLKGLGTRRTVGVQVQSRNPGQSAVAETVFITPDTPSRVQSLAVAVRAARAAVTWAAPSSNGGAVVMGYQYRWRVKGRKTTRWRTAIVPHVALRDGKRGVRYQVQVRAQNAIGKGPAAKKWFRLPKPKPKPKPKPGKGSKGR